MLLRRALLGLLLGVLLAAQTLALVHRSVHSPVQGFGQLAGHATNLVGGWASGLEAGHDAAPTCEIFDQLSQSGAPFMQQAAVLPTALSLYLLPWFQGEAVARWAALFDARGPPFLR